MKDKICRVTIILGIAVILYMISGENDITEKRVLENSLISDYTEKVGIIEMDTEIADKSTLSTELLDIEYRLDTESFESETNIETEERCVEAEEIEEQEDLSMWIGKYKFFESYPYEEGGMLYFEDYEIELFEDSPGKFFADIIIHGHLTSIAVRAKVCGDSEEIRFFFNKYLSNHSAMWTYSEDSPLLSFRRESGTGNICTYWGQISAILLNENEESGKIYFEKVEEN